MLPGYRKAEIKKVLAEMIMRSLAGKGQPDLEEDHGSAIICRALLV